MHFNVEKQIFFHDTAKKLLGLFKKTYNVLHLSGHRDHQVPVLIERKTIQCFFCVDRNDSFAMIQIKTRDRI